MGDYHSDRCFADRFIPEMKRVIGPYLLEPSAFEMDAEQATDLVVLKAKDIRIACRVRRPGYLDLYPWQFTIRAARDSGAKTELKKIQEGWGDWMFYGHAKEDDEPILAQWFLLDLNAFRYQLSLDGYRKDERRHILRGKKPNGDGTHFAWFDVRSFDPEPPLLIACDVQMASPDDSGGAQTNEEWRAQYAAYETGMAAGGSP